MTLERGNCLALITPPPLQLLVRASCHWSTLLLNKADEDWPVERVAEDGATYEVSRNYSIFAQIGVSPENADGRRRLRVSLWTGWSQEHNGTEPLLGAPIDVDHEVELEPETPTFLKFRESREMLGATDSDPGVEHVSFPGGMLIACLNSGRSSHVTLSWSFAFPVAAVLWDVMDEQRFCTSDGFLGAPQAPPVRPVAKTMEQSLAEARGKRQRGK